MKKSKFFSIFLGVVLLLTSAFCLIFIKGTQSNPTKTYAQPIPPVTYRTNDEVSTNGQLISAGNIPVSLYTTKPLVGGEFNNEITDYYPVFNTSVNNNITYYTIDEATIPHILLSSKNASSGGDVLNNLYNTTINFKFNNANARTDPSVNYGRISGLGFISPYLTLNNSTSSSINLKAEPESLVDLDDNGYSFSLNLQPLFNKDSTKNGNAKCPILKSTPSGDVGHETEDNYLGGNGTDNDVSLRNGLYTITIEFNYTLSSSNVSNKCIFQISFYVIDYSNYITTEAQKPLSFENTDIYSNGSDQFTKEYHIFNYNYSNAPIVKYDATKFALNFKYKVGNKEALVFDFNYVSFEHISNQEYNGIITLYCPQIKKYYQFYTYQTEELTNQAFFDLQDFENNFILQNKNDIFTSVFQGTYVFSLDLLTPGGTQETFTKISNQLFNEDVTKNLTSQELIIFGFDLRYEKASTTNQNNTTSTKLVNDYTHNNIASFNSLTSANETVVLTNQGDLVENGNFINVPDKIATTDYPQLYFHSLGNLRNSTGSQVANYTLYNILTTNENTLIGSLKTVTDTTGFDALINENLKSYSQTTQGLSSDGIYLMNMRYYITFTLTVVTTGDDGSTNLNLENRSIEGNQYVLFAINNSTRNLFIHGIDDDGYYTFNNYTNKKVRVAIEQKENFFAYPTNVTYSLSSTYDNNQTSAGTLSLKKNSDGTNESYVINGTTYNYYVLSNLSNYTFSANGKYKVGIKKVDSITGYNYVFNIDNNSISQVKINEVVKNDVGEYIRGNEILSNDLSSDFLKKNLYITNNAFTLSWATKTSGAKSYVYCAFMNLDEDSTSNYSLFKKSNGNDTYNYFLTNNYYLDDVIKNSETNYENSYMLENLNPNNYFKKSGLYYFYIYDQAGNSTSLAVLIDDSNPAIAQGSWKGVAEKSEWEDSFDSTHNFNNYINKDTILYYGTHKAICLPDLNGSDVSISIANISYTNIFDLNTGNLKEKQTININFYNDVLLALKNSTNYISEIDYTQKDLFNRVTIADGSSKFYLTIANNTVEYQFEPNGKQSISGTLSQPFYCSVLYMTEDDIFSGEGSYYFKLINGNGNYLIREVNMSFENVKFNFFAYNEDEEIHMISKNSGTNLNNLGLEYIKLNSNLSTYYQIQSLTYDYYPFVVNSSDPRYSESTFPFSNVAESSAVELTSQSDDGITYVVDKINTASGTISMTKPGKYVIKRTYRGGPYVYDKDTNSYKLSSLSDENGNYGGDYYQDTNGNYTRLFTIDPKERSFVIYVDHNEIISSDTLVAGGNTKEIGDNISIKLGNNAWTFKDFDEISNNSSYLITNEIPLIINVPVSKYFATSTQNAIGYIFSNLNFAKLNATIKHIDLNGNIKNYVVDGYDTSSGYCVCSALVTTSNPKGLLIFDKQGRYDVRIFDNTGYNTYNNDAYETNNNPTSLSFSFQILYSSPYAQSYVKVFDRNGESYERELIDESNNGTYAINTPKNSGLNSQIVEQDNQLFVKWDDPRTPYLSKVNYITINYSSAGNNKSFVIDLTNYNLNDLATANYIIVVDKNGALSVKMLDAFDRDNFLVYLTIDFYNTNIQSEKFDYQDYYRYKYCLYFDIEIEAVFEVKLSYYSSNNNSFSSTNYNLVIDRTKPNTNLDSLIQNEDFLKTYYSSNLSTFKTENFDIRNINSLPCNLTYTFGVSQAYVLNYNQSETVPYFYVRKYNNYNGEYASITPDMENTVYYQNDSIFGSYPRFSELTLVNNVITIGTNTYYKISYSNNSLYNLIQNATASTPNGYYEIIEKDNAGNYRTFTIYYAQAGQKILEIDGRDENRISFEPTNDRDLTANMIFEISKLSSTLGWGVITLTNQTVDSRFDNVINLTPNINVLSDQLKEKLNQFFRVTLNTRFNFTLSKYNANFPIYTRSISIITNQNSAKLPEPTITEIFDISTNTISYSLDFPVYSDKAILYLKNLTLQKYSQNLSAWQTIVSYDNKEDIKNNNPISRLTKGTYKVIYKDNYNTSTYEYNLYVGEYKIDNFNKQYNFTSDYVYSNENNTYYTGNSFSVTYEANIYKVYVNNVLYSGSNREQLSSSLGSKNCKTFTLDSNYNLDELQANQKVGGKTSYTISYYDITDNSFQKEIKITIYDQLPQVYLTSADGNNEIASTVFESTSQITNSTVKINWGQITGCDYDLLNDSIDNEVSIANIYVKSTADGEYSSGIKIDRNQIISNEGFYKLEIKNKLLGNSRYVYFAIQFGEFPLYSVLVDKQEIAPSPFETLDLSDTATNNMAYFSPESSSQSLIYVLYQAITQLKNNGNLSEIVDRNKTEYDLLIEALGFRDGIFSKENVTIANVFNLSHFYSIYDMQPIYNSNIDLSIIEFVFKNNVLQQYYLANTSNNPTPESVGNDYWTTIYLIFSLRGPIKIEMFATTKTPITNNLLGNSIYYDNNGAINLSIYTTEKELTNSEITGNDVMLGWNSLKNSDSNAIYFYNKGNFIYMLEKYGVSENFKKLDFEVDSTNNRNYSTIYKSGLHKIKFMDLAGNTHLFSTNSLDFEPDVYSINIITQVIYHINFNDKDYNPIQYGVFNNSLSIVIDPYYLSKISGLNLQVTRNGVTYNNYTRQDNVYTFTDSGKYVVTLRASYNNRDLNPATYTFTLLSTNSARLAYEFPEISGYQITKVIRDNQDISDYFMEDGKILYLFISSSDSRSGNGYYTVTLKYGEEDDETLDFSFLISDYIPSIRCNIGYGDTTTSNIELSYNPSYIYNQLGNCYINILVYNNDSKTFYQYGRFAIDSSTTNTSSNIVLSQSYSYFVQVETASGNVISSFRVNKTDPLNTFAIIIIVISVIAVVALVIVVIKLRTRMRIK